MSLTRIVPDRQLLLYGRMARYLNIGLVERIAIVDARQSREAGQGGAH